MRTLTVAGASTNEAVETAEGQTRPLVLSAEVCGDHPRTRGGVRTRQRAAGLVDLQQDVDVLHDSHLALISGRVLVDGGLLALTTRLDPGIRAGQRIYRCVRGFRNRSVTQPARPTSAPHRHPRTASTLPRNPYSPNAFPARFLEITWLFSGRQAHDTARNACEAGSGAVVRARARASRMTAWSGSSPVHSVMACAAWRDEHAEPVHGPAAALGGRAQQPGPRRVRDHVGHHAGRRQRPRSSGTRASASPSPMDVALTSTSTSAADAATRSPSHGRARTTPRSVRAAPAPGPRRAPRTG